MGRWFNSIHAHVLAVALGALVGTALASYAFLYVLVPPPRMPASLVDMAHAVRSEPMAPGVGPVRRGFSQGEPLILDLKDYPRLAAALAKRLARPASDYKVYVSRGDAQRLDVIAKHSAADGQFAASDPLVLGSFAIAARQDGGGWRILERISRNPSGGWTIVSTTGLAAGLLITVLLSWWLSARLTRPIRDFARASEMLSRGQGRTLSASGPNEVRTAARAFNEMQGRIGRHVEERTLMLGAIAHDLRAPLARLRFRLAAAPETLRDATLADIRDMDQLVKKTLDFLAHEAGHYNPELLDLSSLLETIVDDYADLGEAVSAPHVEQTTVFGDSVMLKRAFVNLIDNALKYGGSAQVCVTRTPDGAVVEIADRGPGIPEERRTKVFEPFFRLEGSRNPKTGGTGLGLAIVKSAVDAHGGVVSLGAAPEGGCVARLTLPCEAPAPPCGGG